LAKDPWEAVPAQLAAGTRAVGKVMRIESFGAFVELAPGVEGLVHISELAQGKTVHHAREVVKIGQTLEVIVRETDVERRRLSLALADLDEEGGRAFVAAHGGTLVEEGPHDTLGDLLKSRTKDA
jgi:small subunit ribosomal protein S1